MRRGCLCRNAGVATCRNADERLGPRSPHQFSKKLFSALAEAWQGFASSMLTEPHVRGMQMVKSQNIAAIIFNLWPRSLEACAVTLLAPPPGFSSSSVGGRRSVKPRIIPRPARLGAKRGLTALRAEIDLAATLQKKMPDRLSPPQCLHE